MVRATVVLALALVVIGLPGDVSGQIPPQVTVTPGPTTSAYFIPECDDAVPSYLQGTSYVVSRTGGLSRPLSVDYTLQGNGQPGVHYRSLPGTITIGAGKGLEVNYVAVVRCRPAPSMV